MIEFFKVLWSVIKSHWGTIGGLIAGLGLFWWFNIYEVPTNPIWYWVVAITSGLFVATLGWFFAPVIAATLGIWGLLGTASTGIAIVTLKGIALVNAALASIGGTVFIGKSVITGIAFVFGTTIGGVIDLFF